MNEFLEPFYKSRNPIKTMDEACLQYKLKLMEKKVREPHPYQIILAREFLNWFDKSKMVAFYNRNSIKADEAYDIKVALRRANMYMKFAGSEILLLAVKDTPYQALAPLLKIPPMMVFSPDSDVALLTKVMKKHTKYTLMAGILEGRLLNLDDFLKYGQMDLSSNRVHLVQTLQNAAGNDLCRKLTHHQSTFVTRLEQIGKSESA